MIKLATPSDYPDIIRMARSFHEASPYGPLEFSEQRCEDFFRAYLSGNKTDVIIILACDPEPYGMIIGAASQSPFSNDRVSMEVAWWVDEDKRGSRESLMLMKAYEEWSKRVGCTLTQMAMLPEVTNLEKLYTRMGYRQAEQSYVKEI